jgi:hypothetical protein
MLTVSLATWIAWAILATTSTALPEPAPHITPAPRLRVRADGETTLMIAPDNTCGWEGGNCKSLVRPRSCHSPSANGDPTPQRMPTLLNVRRCTVASWSYKKEPPTLAAAANSLAPAALRASVRHTLDLTRRVARGTVAFRFVPPLPQQRGKCVSGKNIADHQSV